MLDFAELGATVVTSAHFSLSVAGNGDTDWNFEGMDRMFAWMCLVAMGVWGGCGLRQGNATLRDYTGLDGCGWVLESGGEVLEPLNLEDFLDAPEDGMRLEVECDVAENVFSICMVGPMVVLTSCELVR